VKRLLQWWALPAREQWTLVRLFAWLPLVWLGLRLAGFARMTQWAQAALPDRRNDAIENQLEPDALATAQRYATLTGIAARRGLYQANCLHQSLALCRVLRVDGFDARLRVGIRSADLPFEAHAWVDVGGVALGTDATGYLAFDTLEPVRKRSG